MFRDIVIGAVTNYNWNQVKCWANSLDQSGFDGLKAVLCYNVSYDLVEELTKRNYSILAFKKNDEKRKLEYHKDNFNICLDRFFHIWFFLHKIQNREQFRNIIATDVGDVIFQSNPSEWLQENLGDKQILVGSECIQYENEEWNRQNMKLSFGPIIYEFMKDKQVYNAGAIAGNFDAFIDLCQTIYLSCGASPVHVAGGGGPDQAALNVLLSTKAYKDITKFAKSSDGWAAQLEIMANPSKKERLLPFLTENPVIMKDNEVYTNDGKKYCIVHQYDVVPELSKHIREKYA